MGAAVAIAGDRVTPDSLAGDEEGKMMEMWPVDILGLSSSQVLF